MTVVETRVPLTVIAGPTASGKTALAIAWAREAGGEIVSADSQQVYRAFDIGTAKPSPDELSAVPHHLVSAVDPLETFSAAEYQRRADAAIADIASRGRAVFVVGGTGLYLRVLLHGVVDAPGALPSLRAELEAVAAEQGREAVHRRLAEVDPETATKLPPQDLVRVVRALEIHAQTGVPASEFRRAHAFAPDRYAFRLFVLNPPREALYAAINARTEALFARGLVEETRSLLERGYADAAPMRSVGYVQARAVVEGRMTREEAILDTAQETRRYAKRQLTWFRREPGAVFLEPPYARPEP
ncbi:tRNA (adenosine(37)-N6)-dimethylallyltransferase MiaA [Corallococcus praedator]|uniref:tRNA dimethylallyltransferase n=1 Tax=Corallococcus praedator TaxID=2316724 RepID=A0ABX9Q5K4_9BACT|nr:MULTISPECIES: tRNA (adenosine(37)-N6)-dimethylallyltransferase MiaA [Corallococcus]RKH13811.1 tRNA (adenosine(37)-N6)-dimethylallyltransferase MiaA [Corallococcus sp. CA047B]RKH21598.1 tRNA (adenosine(37)-N6)-dimethylallyltransferase MiaA [Corallococcus sp. CA031C]RKH92020.1 tRNA (adenosine(37)-N6)-dimethylallyltransferase MiaA [Corallococcus praedator]